MLNQILSNIRAFKTFDSLCYISSKIIYFCVLECAIFCCDAVLFVSLHASVGDKKSIMPFSKCRVKGHVGSMFC